MICFSHCSYVCWQQCIALPAAVHDHIFWQQPVLQVGLCNSLPVLTTTQNRYPEYCLATALAIVSALSCHCDQRCLLCSSAGILNMQLDMHCLGHCSPVSTQGSRHGWHRQPVDDPALYNRPDISTLLKLHDYQAMPEIFCSDYRLLRRPTAHTIVEKLPGQAHCSNLGITVRTGRIPSGTLPVNSRRCLERSALLSCKITCRTQWEVEDQEG